MRTNPPQTFYSDNVGYRDHLDDIEALASRALNPISDFPPGEDYDMDMDHSITSSEHDSDMSLSDEEGQRDAAALRNKTNNILNEFEEFVQDVSLPASREIMNTLTGDNNRNVRRVDETVKSRLTAGVKDAILQREWSHADRASLDDDGFGMEFEKYEKRRGLFKYTMPLFRGMKFKIITIGVAVLFVSLLIVGNRGSHETKVEELNDAVQENESEDEVVSWFYLQTQTECSDHPTAEVHGEGHSCSWIHSTGRVPLRDARCGHDTTYKKRNGEFLKVKEICKRSCDECENTLNNVSVEPGAQQPVNENDTDTEDVNDTETQIQTETEIQTETQTQTQTELVPEAPLEKYSTTTVISIDTTKCEDNPTAILDANDHTCENYIAHVGRVNLHDARCSHETPLRDGNGAVLLVKDVCRLSCGECGGTEQLLEEQSEAELPQAEIDEIGSMIQVSNSSLLESGATETIVGEMTNWMEPVTLKNYSFHCIDEPDKVVAVGGKTCETYFRDSSLVHLQQLRCSHRTDIRDETGEHFLFVKDICRKSCGLCGIENNNEGLSLAAAGKNELLSQDHPLQETEHASATLDATDSGLISAQQTQETVGATSIQSLPDPDMHEQKAHNNITQRFEPVWYDRSSGWKGTTHAAAVEFCSSFDDTFLCPCECLCKKSSSPIIISLFLKHSSSKDEAYCPMGTFSTVPFGGKRGESTEIYAAAINGPTFWVHVGGEDNICDIKDSDQNWESEKHTTFIMCCKL